VRINGISVLFSCSLKKKLLLQIFNLLKAQTWKEKKATNTTIQSGVEVFFQLLSCYLFQITLNTLIAQIVDHKCFPSLTTSTYVVPDSINPCCLKFVQNAKHESLLPLNFAQSADKNKNSTIKENLLHRRW
jgi:hypothetical protein